MTTRHLIISTTIIATLNCCNISSDNDYDKHSDTIKTSNQGIFSIDTTVKRTIPTDTTTINTQNISKKQNNISWASIDNNYYGNTAFPTTFLDLAKVYLKPDTMSEVLSILKFMTRLRLESIGKNQQYWSLWYKIDFGNSYGYIQSENVATHTFSTIAKGTGNTLYYFIVRDYSEKYNPNLNGFTIYKYDDSKKQFVDTLSVKTNMGHIIKEVIQLQEIQNGWKNVNMLIHAKHIRAYCGGGIADSYIVDANNELSELISTRSVGGEPGDVSYVSNVWLPLKFETGKVLLISEGDVENILDTYSGEFKIYPFPKDLTIPQNELVVFNEKETEDILVENGDPMKNEVDSYKSKTVKDITKFFRWNGTKLVQVK